MGFSPDGKWFLYLNKGRVYSYDLATAKKTAIDGGRSFVDAEDDHDYEKPVYGVAGFSADGKSALLYDRYDLWALPLAGGSPVNVTKGVGAKQETRLRVAPMRPAGAGGGGGGRGGGAGGGGDRPSTSRSRSRSRRTASTRRRPATSAWRRDRRLSR